MDTSVVGGGIIGLAIAWRLAQRGLEVAVWEARSAGAEASWAGAGMLAPGGEMDHRSWWGDLALRSLNQYAEFVRELDAESGVSIDYRSCGALEITTTEEEWRGLQQRAARQQEWGIRAEDAGGQRLFYPDDAAVDPRDLLRALRIACERNGVIIREGQPVEQILVEAGRIVQPGPASTVVLAAGAWSSAVPIHIDGSVVPIERSFPVRGHLVSFAAGNDAPGPILRHGHTYLLDRSNGVTIAGSTTEQVGFLREPEPRHFVDIEQRARALMPGLAARRKRLDGWIGFRPGTESGEPQLGRLADSPVFLAYGHYRNGILMAPATADLIAGQVSASSRTDSSLQASRH